MDETAIAIVSIIFGSGVLIVGMVLLYNMVKLIFSPSRKKQKNRTAEHNHLHYEELALRAETMNRKIRNLEEIILGYEAEKREPI